MNWKFWQRNPKPVGIQRINAGEMRLSDFRSIAGLVIEAKKISDNPAFQQMLAVLKTESPANFTLPALGVQPTDRINYLGQIEGYQKCLNHLELLSRPPERNVKHVEATFELPPQTPPDL